MTDLLNPADSGEVTPPDWANAETATRLRTAAYLPAADATIITGEILADETPTAVLFAAAVGADERLVGEASDDVPDYAAFGPAQPKPPHPLPPPPPKPAALTEPAAEHPIVRGPGRRRGRGRAPLPTWMVFSLGTGVGWLANLVTMVVLLWQLSEATR